jgi:hypothetical protein
MNIQSILLMMTMAMGAGDLSNHPAGVNQGRIENGNHVITRLVGREKTLTITTSTRGLSYSVADASGRSLMNAGTLEELRQKHPELWQQVSTGLASEIPARGELIDASISRDAGF